MRYHTDSHHPSCGEFLAEYNACYDRTPVRSVAELNALIAHTLHGLKTVRCPLLVIRAGKDETVAPESAEIIMNRAASSKKWLLTLPDSPHVCTLGPERERLFREIARFLDAR